ncbi:helix-turn-helix transcriptional regulator [Vibrio agarivorans]|uniref:LuxR C-terminal-related transcriptional regulator n=1 Tax=Vibrio agarivorans TaxID=153622 RepID=A0ABT7XZJ1_9VIBR|nr:LuxR C-terminal-related transcriptional regulator [Vibrio agarivorans]MDN2481196.1 LuxR C-terminal-related transcriptional regulator [Vibrio agarivorans]
MTITNEQTFEELMQAQVNTLTACQPRDFDTKFRELSLQAMEWFQIDRITLFPNSMLLLNDGKTVSVARSSIPELDKQRFVSGNFMDYIKLLRSAERIQTFDLEALKRSKIEPIKTLYKEGACWHGIIHLELFGQTWGALACARFNQDIPPLSDDDMRRFKLLCDTWLIYWQHSSVVRSFHIDGDKPIDESEKLLKLTKKQCSVLSLLAQGFTAKQCAEKLFLSPRTVESHKYRMLDQLNFETHTELVQFALRNGLGFES